MKFHEPVLKNEILEYLSINPEGIYVDMTLGGGGHSIEILKKLSDKGKLIGVDQDKEAIKYANDILNDYDNYVLYNALIFISHPPPQSLSLLLLTRIVGVQSA